MTLIQFEVKNLSQPTVKIEASDIHMYGTQRQYGSQISALII